MVTPKTGRPIGRPADPGKADALVEAGWALFLERGVEGASLETVARTAGVSKATLYKHFPDKAALFEAGVLREMRKIEDAQGSRSAGPSAGAGEHAGDAEAEDLEEVLIRFGTGIMSFIVSEPAVRFYAVLAGELDRHEDLARRFYSMGPGRTRANLTAILAAAAGRGELDLGDPEEAAEQLFGMWQGFSNFQLSLGVEAQAVRDALPARVQKAVKLFMGAYRPTRSPTKNEFMPDDG